MQVNVSPFCAIIEQDDCNDDRRESERQLQLPSREKVSKSDPTTLPSLSLWWYSFRPAPTHTSLSPQTPLCHLWIKHIFFRQLSFPFRRYILLFSPPPKYYSAPFSILSPSDNVVNPIKALFLSSPISPKMLAAYIYVELYQVNNKQPTPGLLFRLILSSC